MILTCRLNWVHYSLWQTDRQTRHGNKNNFQGSRGFILLPKKGLPWSAFRTPEFFFSTWPEIWLLEPVSGYFMILVRNPILLLLPPKTTLVIYMYSGVGHRSPIILLWIAICRGEIDVNLGIFCTCEISTNSNANEESICKRY